MDNFKNFCKEIEENADKKKSIFEKSIPQLKVASIIEIMAVPLNLNLSKQKKEEFAQQVLEESMKDDVISPLSNQLGEPQEDESEEDFIRRGTDIVRKILYKKFQISNQEK